MADLRNALPVSAQIELGLPLMGEAVGEGWSDADAQQFEQGLIEYGQDFAAINKQFLPDRTPQKLALYYYNVWKPQFTARAQAWYRRKEVTVVCALLALRCVSSKQDKWLVVVMVTACMLPLTVCCTMVIQYIKANRCCLCIRKSSSPGCAIAMQ